MKWLHQDAIASQLDLGLLKSLIVLVLVLSRYKCCDRVGEVSGESSFLWPRNLWGNIRQTERASKMLGYGSRIVDQPVLPSKEASVVSNELKSLWLQWPWTGEFRRLAPFSAVSAPWCAKIKVLQAKFVMTPSEVSHWLQWPCQSQWIPSQTKCCLKSYQPRTT